MNYAKRLAKVKELLKKNSLAAVLVSNVFDIVYLTGFSNFSSHEREAYLFITSDKQYILTDGRYSEAVEQQVPHFGLTIISSETPYKEAFKQIIRSNNIKTLGIDENDISVKESNMLYQYTSTLIHFSLSSLREVKDAEEVSRITSACQLGDKTFDYILGKLKPGVSEKEIDFEIEFFIKKHDAETSFDSIVAFGPHSSVPHHKTSDTKLKPNSIVLLDFGVKLNNYCSDMTRTIYFGSSTDEFKRMYQTVHGAQKKVIEFLNHPERQRRTPFARGNSVKTPLKDVDAIARRYIIDHGYPTIPHSLGHGIGLEVHEAPRLSPTSDSNVTSGMVFSIEPGIYIPGFGGVRIEDLVVIKKSGIEILTKSKKDLIEL